MGQKISSNNSLYISAKDIRDIFIILLFIILLVPACSRKVRDEKALAEIETIAIQLYIDDTFHLSVLHNFPWLSVRWPNLYLTLFEDNSDAITKCISSNDTVTISFKNLAPNSLEELYKILPSLLAGKTREVIVSRIEEKTKFGKKKTIKKLAQSSGSDAVLLLKVSYDSKTDPSITDADSGDAVSPNVSWLVDLYNHEGNKIWSDEFSKRGERTISIGHWTKEVRRKPATTQIETTTKLVLNENRLEMFNRIIANEFSSMMIDSLTNDIKRARSHKL